MFQKTVILRSGLSVRQAEVGQYLIDFYECGQNLAITFETAGSRVNRTDALRDPWGMGFLASHGFSVLGIKSSVPNWYRGRRILEWFGSGSVQEFLGKFDRHVFTGSSMGGFAAITFSRVSPGSLVIAHNPQSTLNVSIVPWEHRFLEGRHQNWLGEFADAADAAPLARRIYVTYDPFHSNDRKHVERLVGANIEHLKMPFLGHETPRWLKDMGVLDKVTDAALDESLTSVGFAKIMRQRKILPRYHQLLLEALQSKRGISTSANHISRKSGDEAPG